MKKYAVWLKYGSFVLTSIIIVLLFSCSEKPKRVETPVDDFLKVPEYKTEEPVRYNSNYTPTTITDTTISSYWWIIVEEKGGTMRYSSFIKQNHSYFSYAEMKKEYDKPVFMVSLVKVDKETYEHNVDE
jgi:hypothetical protein